MAMVRGRQAVGMKMMRKVVAALALAAGLSGSAATAESLADAMIAAYRNSNLLEQHMPTITQLMEQSLRLQEELTALLKKLEACGDNEYCQKKVGA